MRIGIQVLALVVALFCGGSAEAQRPDTAAPGVRITPRADAARRPGIAMAPPSRREPRVAVVYDMITQEPLVEAEVVDRLTGNSVKTSKTGHFALFTPEFVGPERALLVVRKLGYEPLTVAVNPSDTTMLFLPLERTGAMLEAVKILGEVDILKDPGLRAGFLRRCASGARVQCLTPSELAKKPSYRVTDFLRTTKGVAWMCTMTRCMPRMRAITGGFCAPTYFVNGFQVAAPGMATEDFLDQNFDWSELRGIEVYEANDPRPIRFVAPSMDVGARMSSIFSRPDLAWQLDPAIPMGTATGNVGTCGAVVIWTR